MVKKKIPKVAKSYDDEEEEHDEDFLNDFYKYWTEPNKSNSKLC